MESKEEGDSERKTKKKLRSDVTDVETTLKKDDIQKKKKSSRDNKVSRKLRREMTDRKGYTE